ncbi:uncharacterized protein LOC128642499 isoform X2 [Bombina bombina]|uniref:uncharacterized protein LOC128642499 isoform X2 n=1 Tax=Bombina bombina TaxID=8345 RepID=UPI00235AAD85|nr:uncharacterized protein LOC128642499 isoform X2 [Bombina bombina]
MLDVNGSISLYPDTQTLIVNLSAICKSVNISIHDFPVTYGIFQDPCNIQNIGPSLYNFSLTSVVSVHLGDWLWPVGRSVVIETCGHSTCANFHDSRGSEQVWQIIFHSFLVGQVHLLQGSNQTSITALTELALLEGIPLFAASLYFSDNCLSHDRYFLGNVGVGNRFNSARNHIELNVSSVMPFLVIEYQTQLACAEVRNLQSKKATAQFNMLGVNGSFIFQQKSPFHQTQLKIELWKLRGLADHYSIHSLPVPARQYTSQDLCGVMGTGEIWNPFAISENRLRNEWLLGDLSGRHGSLKGREEFKTVLVDQNLSLYGINSIIGRSVVISQINGLHWVCSTIRQEGKMFVAQASFHMSIVGRVIFWQPLENPYDLSILIELSPISGIASKDHNWHVHEYPLQGEEDTCNNTGGHLNPYKAPTGFNYSQACKNSSPFLCEMGDFTGRHMPITFNGSNLTRYFFTDTFASLNGSTSILGKPLVIHGPERSLSRIACANIILKHPMQGKTGPWFGSGDAQGELSASQATDLDPTSIQIYFQGLKGYAGGFHIHLLPVRGNSDNPCSDTLIQGHFNPFGVNILDSPITGNGTDDEYEVGDISGRRGSLKNKDQMTTQFLDTNFPLFGTNSILGRSLVIHYVNGSRMQCSSFLPEMTTDGERIQAKVYFPFGNFSFTQMVYSDGGSSDTIILVDLQVPLSVPSKGSSLTWNISTSFFGDEVYNPYGIPKVVQDPSLSSPHNLLHCRVGDLTTKHGNMTVGQTYLVTDTNLPLAGDFTVLGMFLNVGIPSYSVSNQILPDVPITSIMFSRGIPFNRSAFRETVSVALRIPSWKVTVLRRIQEVNVECQEVKVFVIGFHDISALASLQTHQSLVSIGAAPQCLPDL